MRKTHLYINGGGSLMQDVTSHRSLWFYLFTISWAKRLGNQVMMYGCGIGPIHPPPTAAGPPACSRGAWTPSPYGTHTPPRNWRTWG